MWDGNKEDSYSAERKRSADIHRTIKMIQALMSLMKMMIMMIAASLKIAATHLDALLLKVLADE